MILCAQNNLQQRSHQGYFPLSNKRVWNDILPQKQGGFWNILGFQVSKKKKII